MTFVFQYMSRIILFLKVKTEHRRLFLRLTHLVHVIRRNQMIYKQMQKILIKIMLPDRLALTYKEFRRSQRALYHKRHVA